MDVERMGYIVYFRNKQVIERLEKMPVNVTFVSEKLKYAIFYGEKKQFRTYLNTLRKTRGFIRLEEQPMFSEELNFSVK